MNVFSFFDVISSSLKSQCTYWMPDSKQRLATIWPMMLATVSESFLFGRDRGWLASDEFGTFKKLSIGDSSSDESHRKWPTRSRTPSATRHPRTRRSELCRCDARSGRRHTYLSCRIPLCWRGEEVRVSWTRIWKFGWTTRGRPLIDRVFEDEPTCSRRSDSSHPAPSPTASARTASAPDSSDSSKRFVGSVDRFRSICFVRSPLGRPRTRSRSSLSSFEAHANFASHLVDCSSWSGSPRTPDRSGGSRWTGSSARSKTERSLTFRTRCFELRFTWFSVAQRIRIFDLVLVKVRFYKKSFYHVKTCETRFIQCFVWKKFATI